MATAVKTSMGGWRLAAAALTLAVAGGAAQLAQAMPGGMGGMGGHGPGGHGGRGEMMMHGRLLESVGASAEQQARIRDIMQAARADMRKLHEGAGDLHAQTAQVFAAPTVDARAAEALRQKRLALHDAASKRMQQAMLDAAAVLTPEQRQKMAEAMGKRHDMAQRHRRERMQLDGGPRQ